MYMNNFEQDYKQLISDIISFGTKQTNRTGTDTRVLPNRTLVFRNLGTNQIPLITGKKVDYLKAYHEFLWIQSGNTNIEYLNENGIFWWDEYADENGDLGKTYGYQMRSYNGHFDQFEYVISEINKGSRRAYITFWNPTDLKETALPCCYTGMKFTLSNNSKVLNASINFRSSDVFLGLPFDLIFGYHMLRIIAHATGKKIGDIAYHLDDAHLYENHIAQCLSYLSLPHYELPTIQQAETKNYKSGPYLKAKMNN